MLQIDAGAVAAALTFPKAVDVLAAGFRTGAVSPLRHHHTIDLGARPAATLLLMPAWTRAHADGDAAGRYLGFKLVTVTPDNGVRFSKPAIAGLYVLISTEDGAPLALINAAELTARRTAAASGLAARYLARADACNLTVIGAGALAPQLIRAHASVRPIRTVRIWNRTRAHAERVAALFDDTPLNVIVADDLEAAVRAADILSTATLSQTPVFQGDWLSPGVHVDLVGAFRPDMRESDDVAITRARIWADTMTGGLKEAGDLVIPIAEGVLDPDRIEGDLFGLTSETAPVRRNPDEITLFKSVGASIEDLYAAIAVYEEVAGCGDGAGER